VIPENVSFEEAESAFRERRYGDAVNLFTGYVGRRPENPWGHYMLGLSAWKAGEHAKAERAFEEALRLDPKHVKSLLNWSRVLLETGRPDQALEKIEAALATDSTSSDVFRLRGLALAELGCPEDAIEAYRRAIVLDDQDAWSMNNLGLVLIREGRFEEALGPLARAVEIRQDVPTFWNNLGIALERTGHLRAAEEAYRKAFAADAGYEKASVSLARVEVLSEDSTVQPIDLAVLARGFEEEVRGWRQSTLSQVSDGVTGFDSEGTSRSVVVTPLERTPTPPDQP
jgi:Flp pilus assembly protein TadD